MMQIQRQIDIDMMQNIKIYGQRYDAKYIDRQIEKSWKIQKQIDRDMIQNTEIDRQRYDAKYKNRQK